MCGAYYYNTISQQRQLNLTIKPRNDKNRARTVVGIGKENFKNIEKFWKIKSWFLIGLLCKQSDV